MTQSISKLALITLVSSLFAGALIAKDRFAVGLKVGNGNGLTGKYWINETTAVDASLALGFGFNAGTIISANANYLIHRNDLQQIDNAIAKNTKLYYGAGLGFASYRGSLVSTSLRAPVGVEWRNPTDLPISAFLELAPSLFVVPVAAQTTVAFAIGGSLGARYNF